MLQRLLAQGTAHSPLLMALGTDALRAAAAQPLSLLPSSDSGGGGGERETLAPAAVVRVRAAALGCMEAVCGCQDAALAVRTLTWSMGEVRRPG